MAKKTKKQCIGCLNIKQRDFPFEETDYYSGKKGYFIDSEGCGLTEEGDYFLRIYYCPVCGKKLK